MHTGTTETGHYYSFVRERVPLVPGQEPRWISFNDSNVELYDAKQIPADCYGGLSDQVMKRIFFCDPPRRSDVCCSYFVWPGAH